MTRYSSDSTKAQMRAEFASARAEFLASATPLERKIDAFLSKVEAAVEFLLGWWLVSPTAAKDAIES